MNLSIKSCALGGCDGAYYSGSNSASCRNHFRGRPCIPAGGPTCGSPQGCDDGNCGGTIDDRASGAATCKNAYKGCPCNAGPFTPGGCGEVPCNTIGCVGEIVGSDEFVECVAGAKQGFRCLPIVLPPPMVIPSPPPNPDPDRERPPRKSKNGRPGMGKRGGGGGGGGSGAPNDCPGDKPPTPGGEETYPCP